jgi:hypothetical protein
MNKLSLFSASFALCTTSLFSFDKYLDVNFVSEISHQEQKMHVDVGTEGSIAMGDKVFIVNPKLSLFLDGSMDASVAAGFRHETSLGYFGHHLFWDSTSTKDGHFNQAGLSIDLLTDGFDYRVNYYHPLTQEKTTDSLVLSPHRWVEGEVIFKHPHFQVGLGPKYNLFDKEWGTQFKVTVPFQHFSVEAFVSHDNKNSFRGCLSFSFSLYSTPRSGYADAPISHRSRVQYSKEPVYIPDAQMTKKKTPEEPVVVAVVEKEPASIVPIPIPAPEPKETHWYDFILKIGERNDALPAMDASHVDWIPSFSSFGSRDDHINEPVVAVAAPAPVPVQAQAQPQVADVAHANSGDESPRTPVEDADWTFVRTPVSPDSPRNPHAPGGM